MPPQNWNEEWLASWIQLELDALLRLKENSAEPPTRNKYSRVTDGLKIRCNVDHLHRIVQLVEFLDVIDIVSATIKDTTSVINAKFSDKARRTCSERDKVDLVSLNAGVYLKLENYDIHLTLLGDTAWNVSILIQDFRVLPKVGLDIGTLRPPAVIASRKIQQSLIALLGERFDKGSSQYDTDPSDMEVDSDIASQDGDRLENPSSISSQVPFAIEQQPLVKPGSRMDPNVQELRGVNLSGPQLRERDTRGMSPGNSERNAEQVTYGVNLQSSQPRERNTRRISSGNSERNAEQVPHGVNLQSPQPRERNTRRMNPGNSERNAEQLLALFSRQQQTKAGNDENNANQFAKNKGPTAIQPKLKTRAPIDIPQTATNNKTGPQPLDLPSSTKSGPVASKNDTVHENDFDFMKNITVFKPVKGQRGILNGPSSWQLPAPPLQFPTSLNAPPKVLEHFESSIANEQKQSESGCRNEGLAEKTSKGQFYGQAKDDVVSQKDDNDVTVDDSPGTPNTAITWSPTVSSRSVTGHVVSRDEPRDSSAESERFNPANSTQQNAGSQKRGRTPTSPLEDARHEKRPKRRFYFECGFIPTRGGRRGTPHRPPGRGLDGAGDSNAEELDYSDSPVAASSGIHSFSPTPDASQQTVARVRSTDISAKSSSQFSPIIVTSALATDKVTESAISSGKPSLANRVGSSQPQTERPLSRASVHPVVGCLEPHGVQNNRGGESLSTQSLDSKKNPSNSSSTNPNESVPWTDVLRHSTKSSQVYSGDPSPQDSFQESSPKSFRDVPKEAKSIKRRHPKGRNPNQICSETSSINPLAQSSFATMSKRGENGIQEAQQKVSGDISSRNQWWKSGETVFKRFARDYASLKSIGGSLGTPCAEDGPSNEQKDLDVLSWRL